MKLWHVAALLVGIGIVYVLVKRPTVSSSAYLGPSTSNDLFSSIFKLGAAAIGKIGAPSAIPNEGTYYTGNTTVDGNTLVNDSGTPLTYGTD